MVSFSVCHVLFARRAVVFSCCALVSLLLLCSRVPSPAVLLCPFSCCAVRALSSSLPAKLTRPFFFCTSSTDPTHYSTPSRALSGARHIVSSTSLCVVSLDRSVAFPVQSLQRTELIRHIFFNPISFFLLSFFLFSSSSLAQSTACSKQKGGHGTTGADAVYFFIYSRRVLPNVGVRNRAQSGDDVRRFEEVCPRDSEPFGVCFCDEYFLTPSSCEDGLCFSNHHHPRT